MHRGCLAVIPLITSDHGLEDAVEQSLGDGLAMVVGANHERVLVAFGG
jgi:hypothetical protein